MLVASPVAVVVVAAEAAVVVLVALRLKPVRGVTAANVDAGVANKGVPPSLKPAVVLAVLALALVAGRADAALLVAGVENENPPLALAAGAVVAAVTGALRRLPNIDVPPADVAAAAVPKPPPSVLPVVPPKPLNAKPPALAVVDPDCVVVAVAAVVGFKPPNPMG